MAGVRGRSKTSSEVFVCDVWSSSLSPIIYHLSSARTCSLHTQQAIGITCAAHIAKYTLPSTIYYPCLTTYHPTSHQPTTNLPPHITEHLPSNNHAGFWPCAIRAIPACAAMFTTGMEIDGHILYYFTTYYFTLQFPYFTDWRINRLTTLTHFRTKYWLIPNYAPAST